MKDIIVNIASSSMCVCVCNVGNNGRYLHLADCTWFTTVITPLITMVMTLAAHSPLSLSLSLSEYQQVMFSYYIPFFCYSF